MKKVIVHSYDAVWSSVDKFGYEILFDFLSYEKVYWVNNGFKKVRKTYQKHLIKKVSGKYLFLTGLVKKVLLFLQENGYEYNYTSDIPVVNYDPIKLPGIQLRPYQEELIDKAVLAGRGCIYAATGIGKSYILMGIVSCFSMERILILVHTIDLVKQLYDDLEKFGFSPEIINTKKISSNRVCISTIQTFRRVVLDYSDVYDCVFCDEMHHIRSIGSKNYGYSLTRLSAPVKIALGASLPESIEGRFALEGLIGPILGSYSIQDAAKENILAKPKIYMLETEKIPGVSKITDFHLAYKFNISLNQKRNRQIVSTVIQLIETGETILILIQSLAHGEEIQKLLKKRGYDVPFAQGKSDKFERERLKNKLKNKEIPAILASVIFVEGIDIPSLSAVIVCSCGKSEIQILQRVGRGLRMDKNKKEVIIIDFLDCSHKWFKKHSKKHLALYTENNWDVKIIPIGQRLF